MDKDKSFIADFYKFAFVGLVIDWIKKGMREEPRDIIKRLNTLITGNIEMALERYRTTIYDKKNNLYSIEGEKDTIL